MVDKDDAKDEGKVGSQAHSFPMHPHAWRIVKTSSWHKQVMMAEGKEIIRWDQIIKDWIYLELNRVDFSLKTIGARMI